MTDWRPTASLETLQRRATLLRQIREFFHHRGVLEVETPSLSHAANPDPHLQTLVVGDGAAPYYLNTSPEFAMKRLLAAGSGDIYQICHVFRQGEAGRRHNPEFTLLEWYRLGFDHWQLMAEVAELLQSLLGEDVVLAEPSYMAYAEAFIQHAGLDPLSASVADYQATARDFGLEGLEGEEDPAILQDWLFSHRVQPQLGQGGLCFVHGYPAAQAALARLEPDNPALSRRFEVYYQGLELGNGFHELSDAEEQRRRFVQQNQRRRQQGQTELPLDESLLAALAAGLPDCAGVAIGLDRLLMVLLGKSHVAEVLSFDAARC